MELLGLYGGLTLAVIGWFFGRKAAHNKGRMDELQVHIMLKARSFSWFMTIAAIYLLMSLHIVGVKLNIMPSLSILLFVMLASWGIASVVYAMGFTGIKMKKAIIVSSILIGILLPLLFVVIALLIDNWKVILAAIPPIMINIVTTITALRNANEELKQ